MNPPGAARLAAATVVPVLLLAACGDASSPSAADPTSASSMAPSTGSPTQTPSSSSSSSSSESASSAPTRWVGDGPVVLSFKGLAEGAPPALPYLRHDPGAAGGWSLVEADGRARPLDRAYAQFAPMGDGLVGLVYDDDQAVAYVLDGGLHETSHADTADGGLAVTPDGSIVGWLGADKAPHFVERGGTREGTLPTVEGGSSLAAILADGTTCQEGEDGNGCAAYVNSPDASQAWWSISHGIVDTVPGVVAVGDVADDAGLLGMTSLSDEGSCWAMFEGGRRRPAWQTCDYTLFDFSPSGRRILAGPAYLDGFGQGFAAVLDRSGQVLAEWHSEDQAAILGTTWEDEDHVLVTAFQDDEYAVIRVDLDGTVEFALPPVPDPGSGAAYVLPVR